MKPLELATIDNLKSTILMEESPSEETQSIKSQMQVRAETHKPDERLSKAESSLSGIAKDSKCKATRILNDQQIGAFSDNSSEVDLIYSLKRMNESQNKLLTSEPTRIQIERAVNILKIEYTDRCVQKIIQILFERMSVNNLPNFGQQSKEESLSRNSDPKQNSKQVQINKYIFVEDLVSIKSQKQQEQQQSRRNIYPRNSEVQQYIRKRQIQKQRERQKIKQKEKQKQRQKRRQQQLIQNQRASKRPEDKINDIVKVVVNKPDQFTNNYQKQKFIEKRTTAKAFIRRGYGLAFLRQQIIQTKVQFLFEESRYKTVCYAVAAETFRKLEQFLEENCEQYNYQLEKIQMKYAYSILLNCRETFPDECKTFIKLMQALYLVDVQQFIYISKRQALRLHQKIIQVYKKKISDNKLGKSHDYKRDRDWTKDKELSKEFSSHYLQNHYANSRSLPDDEAIRSDNWTTQMDKQLMSYYRVQHTPVKVRERYRQKYGTYTAYQDAKLLKSRISKVMRQAIRKVKSAVAETRELSNYVPFLNTLNNVNIKIILISPDAIQARTALADAFISNSLNSMMLMRVMKMMEEALHNHKVRKGDFMQKFDDDQF